MFNVVVKTALKTLLGVIIALLIAFAIASLGFPGSMASLFENWGNYSLATGYASLSYSYSGNAEDLARCFQDSVLAGNDGDIVRSAKSFTPTKILPTSAKAKTNSWVQSAEK